MVAAEAAACGALPVVANHSGLGEVARTLREAVPRGGARVALVRGRRRRRCRSSPTRSRAGSRRPTTCAPRTREAIVEVTREPATRGTASPRTVIAAAQGELGRPARAGLTCQAAVARAIAAMTAAKTVTAVESATSSVSRPVEITEVATPR